LLFSGANFFRPPGKMPSRTPMFSSDVIPGRCSLIAENFKIFCFLQFQNLTTNIFAAVLSILPLCQRSVSLVSTQVSEPCYEPIKVTDTFIYSVSLRFRFRTSIPKLSLAMYSFRASAFRYMNIYP